MKLRISTSIFLLAFSATAFAAPAPTSGKLYAGIFGGYASSNKFNVNQYGTAYYTEASGGPLAVNAFGQAGNESSGFWGAQLGYQAPSLTVNPCWQWTLAPAAELEGFSMSNTTFNASLINTTTRLPEHNFSVSYPLSRNVFLANAVLSFNHPSLLIHPYLGFGIGGALMRVSGADATQVAPVEVGVNHYNSNPNSNDTTFAGQIKLGFSYDFNQYVSLFADYRWLYLGSTHYVFGSTVYTTPPHPETSSWQVNMDAQRYNMGNVGIRVSV